MLVRHAPILETPPLQAAPAVVQAHWRDESGCAAFAQALARLMRAEPALRNLSIELHGSLGAGKTTFVRHLLQALGVQGRIKSPTFAVMESYQLPDVESEVSMAAWTVAGSVPSSISSPGSSPGSSSDTGPGAAAARDPYPDAAGVASADSPANASAHAASAAAGTGLAISHFDFYRFEDPRDWSDSGFRDVFAAPGLKLVEWPEHALGLLPSADLSLHIQVQDDDSRMVRAESGTDPGRQLLAGLGSSAAPL